MASNVAPHTSHAVTCDGAASCGMISRGITDSVPAPYVRSTREKQYVAKQSLQQTLARHSRERSVPHRSQRRTFCGYSGVLLCVQRSSRGSVKLTSVPDAQCTHEKKNELAKYSRAGFNLRAQGQTAQRSMRTVLLIATLSSKALRRNLHAHNRLVCGAQTEATPKAAKENKQVAHPWRWQVQMLLELQLPATAHAATK